VQVVVGRHVVVHHELVAPDQFLLVVVALDEPDLADLLPAELPLLDPEADEVVVDEEFLAGERVGGDVVGFAEEAVACVGEGGRLRSSNLNLVR
jgi:hypothetical protein